MLFLAVIPMYTCGCDGGSLGELCCAGLTEHKTGSVPADYGTSWVRVSINVNELLAHRGLVLDDERYTQRR